MIDHRTFDREHLQLCRAPAVGGNPAGFTARGKHTMTGHHNRTRVVPERLADVARQLEAAEPPGNVAIGHRLAGRNGAGDVIDAAVEFRYALQIEHDIPEVVRLALEQFDHAIDRVLHARWRPR